MTIYESNKHAAFTATFNHCNQTMKNRIKETLNYEKEIQNNLFELSEEIKIRDEEIQAIKYSAIDFRERIKDLDQQRCELLLE